MSESMSGALATDLSEEFWRASHNGYTPNERWHLDRPSCRYENFKHWYEASADFARQYLPVSGDGKLLCVGSPIFEATELEADGWDVTYLDVREPPGVVKWAKGDAADMPFEAGSFDALSSSCVICHVGLGRYGDAVRVNGDMDMLRECKRVLKAGALMQIAIPVIPGDTPCRLGNCHRVYPVMRTFEMARECGFRIERYAIWDSSESKWGVESDVLLSQNLAYPDYISMLLRS